MTTTKIQAKDIKPGMIVKIYGGTEQIAVEKASVDKWGAVTITDAIDRSRGLSQTETVEVAGYFNPES